MGQALLSAYAEAKIVPEDLLQSISTLSGQNLIEWIKRIRDLPDPPQELLPHQMHLHLIRKLSVVKDPEAKSRVIAIYDYWSQTCLKPIHDQISLILDRIPQDCTSDQSRFLSRINPQGEFNSLDLTACTDRLPVAIQEVLCEHVFGSKEKASA